MDEMASWTEIRTWFAELLEMDPGERARRLELLAQRQPALAQELAELLEHSEQAEGVFEDELRDVLSGSLHELRSPDELETLPEGGRIGPYQVTEVVGRGGGGTVYRAERIDGAFQQDVAVKVLRRGLDTVDLLARFRAERQILASLAHPNIAQLLDGGSLPDGRPYLVMEFVDGEAVDVLCERNDLSLPDRLGLFLQVCDAVAHAHRNLVLHRDLKPSNILVDAAGDVRLLDFGIAKILDPEGFADEVPHTRVGVRLLTPGYAAPEQIEGKASDATTDVYQLGHLLYLLVTGRSPYELGDSPSQQELHQAIREVVPQSPGEVAASQGAPWAQELKGDLDAIILKALRKEPDRRYRSVDRLAEDLRRHLSGHPVRARPDTLTYRSSRFLRRHPWLVAMAATVVLVLGAGVAALGLHSAQLEVERDRARIETERAEATQAFLLDLFDLAGESSARDTLTVGSLLEQGRDRLDERVGDHPLVRIEMLRALELAYARMQMDFDAAELALERADAVEEYFGADHPETLLAAQSLGRRLAGRRNWPQAADVLEEAVSIHERLSPSEAQRDTVRVSVWRAFLWLGMSYRELGRTDEALAAVHEAIALREDDLSPLEDLDAHFSGIISLAYVLRGQDRLNEAEELYREALPLARNEEAQALPTLLNNYASLLRAMGRGEEALPLLVEVRNRLLASDELPVGTLDVLMNNLLGLLADLGRHEEAVAAAYEARALFEEVLPPDHWRLGRATQRVGIAYMEAGDCEAGEALMHEAAEFYGEVLGPEAPFTAAARSVHAHCLIELDRLAEAERALLEARPILVGALNPPVVAIQRNLEALVRVYERMERPAQAREFRELLEGMAEPEA